MTAEEFIKEVRGSHLYYPEFEKEYAEFQKYQALAWDTLVEFARVCEKNDIQYFLAYGTLLGAVRDGGQIPWDYDIDVIVSAADRERLIAALDRDLSGEYRYIYRVRDPKYLSSIMRLCPAGYDTRELHVDVFWMVGAPNDRAAAEEYMKALDRILRIRAIKRRSLSAELSKNPKAFVKCLMKKLRFAFTTKASLSQKLENMTVRYPMESAAYCFVPAVPPDRTIYEPADIMRTQRYTVKGREFYVPADIEKCLSQWYRDWKKIYPLESRLNEMRVHYRRLVKHAKLPQK